MHVFVTGATGFIGQALIQSLLGPGYEITAWVRDPQRARQSLGARVQLLATSSSEADLARSLSHVDAVVNLAGESLVSAEAIARLFGPRGDGVGLSSP